MGGGKVTPDDEEPAPQSKAGGAIKKHKRYSLRPGDTQEAAHMQRAAGREHGRLGRPGNSAWREAGPPQGRRGGGGGDGTPLARKSLPRRHQDHLTPTGG